MSCTAKHVSPPVPDEHFKCPKCGAKPDSDGGGFIIDNIADGADPNCPTLHDDDELRCYGCDYSTSGKAFAKQYAKKASLVKCPACKGHGHLPEKRAATVMAVLEKAAIDR